MTPLAWNILLAIVWAVALGPLTSLNLIIGFGVGYAVLFVAWRAAPSGSPLKATGGYFEKTFQILSFVMFFIAALAVANLRMAWYTIGPARNVQPGIIAIPIDTDMSDVEVTTLANLITLTPGTLTIDVAADRSLIFVHVMDARDPDRVIADIQHGFQRRIREIFR